MAAKQLGMDVDDNIKAGCEWIIKNINQKGRLTTPTKDAWGAPEYALSLYIFIVYHH